MIRLGLTITDSVTSATIVENGRIRNSANVKTSGRIEQDLADMTDQLAPELRKIGRTLKTAFIVTDHALSGLKSEKATKVGLIRLSAPEGRDSPPLIALSGLKKILGSFNTINGGHGEDGRIIASPVEDEIRTVYEKAKMSADAFVVSSPFSILNPDHELFAGAALFRLGAKHVWLSSDISYMPCILDRESTAILSASSSRTLSDLEDTVKSALARYKCRPKVYFARNDGSVIGSSLAKRFPLQTAWSEEAHAAAGASKVLKRANCITIGSEQNRSWLAATVGGRPLTRTISYYDRMILHVTSPVVLDFDNSATDAIKRQNFDLISELAGTSFVSAYGGMSNMQFPFKVNQRSGSESFACFNATRAEVSWEWGSNVPKGSNVRKSEDNLRRLVSKHLTWAYVKSGTRKLDKFRSHPGINLPEGTITLSLQAAGKPT